MRTYYINAHREADGVYWGAFEGFAGVTQADSQDAFIAMAQDLLLCGIEACFLSKTPIPEPLPPRSGQLPVVMDTLTEAKVILLNTMLAQNINQTQLAKLLKVSKQEVGRIVNPWHHTKLGTIEKALNLLGVRLRLTSIQ